MVKELKSETGTIPRPLFNFGKLPKTTNACNKFLKTRHIEKGIFRNLTKVKLNFSLAPVPFYKQEYKKQA